MPFPATRIALSYVGSPEVRDPVLMHAPTRESVACFAAVSLSSGRFV